MTTSRTPFSGRGENCPNIEFTPVDLSRLPDFCHLDSVVPFVTGIPSFPIPTVRCQCPVIKPPVVTLKTTNVPEKPVFTMERIGPCCDWDILTKFEFPQYCYCPRFKETKYSEKPPHKRSAPKLKFNVIRNHDCCDFEIEPFILAYDQYCRVPTVKPNKGNFPISLSVVDKKTDLDHCDWDYQLNVENVWEAIFDKTCRCSDFSKPTDYGDGAPKPFVAPTATIERLNPEDSPNENQGCNNCEFQLKFENLTANYCRVPEVLPHSTDIQTPNDGTFPIALEIVNKLVDELHCDFDLQLHVPKMDIVVYPWYCCCHDCCSGDKPSFLRNYNFPGCQASDAVGVHNAYLHSILITGGGDSLPPGSTCFKYEIAFRYRVGQDSDGNPIYAIWKHFTVDLSSLSETLSWRKFEDGAFWLKSICGCKKEREYSVVSIDDYIKAEFKSNFHGAELSLDLNKLIAELRKHNFGGGGNSNLAFHASVDDQEEGDTTYTVRMKDGYAQVVGYDNYNQHIDNEVFHNVSSNLWVWLEWTYSPGGGGTWSCEHSEDSNVPSMGGDLNVPIFRFYLDRGEPNITQFVEGNILVPWTINALDVDN